MKKISIKGTDYIPVNERIKEFWLIHPEWSICTEIVNMIDDKVVMIAKITDGNGVLRSTGTAFEKEGNGFINKHHHVENCETSAVGRALGILGIGIDTSVASWEEVANSVVQDGTPLSDKQKTMIEGLLENSDLPEEKLIEIEQLYLTFNSERAGKCINYLMENKRKTLDEELTQRMQ